MRRKSMVCVMAALVVLCGMALIGVGPGQAVPVSTPNELIFSGVQGTTSAAQNVTVTNTGAAPIQVTAAAISGANATSFTLLNPPGAPITLNPGDSTIFTVQFNPPAGTIGSLSALLDVTTTDLVQPNVSTGLFGLSAQGLAGANEPPLQAVVDTLGYAIDVGGAGLIIGTSTTPIGDEVLMPLFQRAAPGNVTLVPVARYSPSENLPFGFYIPDGSATPPLTALASISFSSSQTLNPAIIAGGTTSFDPGNAHFGIFVDSQSFGRVSYTEDALNTGIPHAARIYPIDNRNNVPIPNTFLVAFEDATNGDFQDYVFLLSNVTAAIQDPPIANPDSAATASGAPITFSVVANDTGVDAPINVASVVLTPPAAAEGTAVANPDGTVTFTPAAGFAGTSTFSYTVQDTAGTTSNAATIQVTVAAAPVPPPPPPAPPPSGQDPAPQPAPVVGGTALSISHGADPSFASAGTNVTFSIIVTNLSGATLNSLLVEHPLPGEFEILGAAAPTGSSNISGQLVTFDLGTLGSGQSINLTVEARIRSGSNVSQLVSQACASASGAARQCAQVSILGVTSLPSTGETPWWRTIILALVSGIIVLTMTATSYLVWRTRPA